MKRKRASGSWSLLTFLDLITCGLGASLLLLLITATAQPSVPRYGRDPTVVVTARSVDLASPVEVGLRYRSLGEARWTLVETPARLHGSVLRPSAGGVLAFAVLDELSEGIYEVQPYLRDHAIDGAAGVSDRRVMIEAFGQGVILADTGDRVPLAWPGNAGQSARLVVKRPRR